MEDMTQTQLKGKQEIEDTRTVIRTLETWIKLWDGVNREAWTIAMRNLNHQQRKLHDLTSKNK